MKRSLISHIGEAFMRWADQTCEPEPVDLGTVNLRQCLMDLHLERGFQDWYADALRDVAEKMGVADGIVWRHTRYD